MSIAFDQPIAATTTRREGTSGAAARADHDHGDYVTASGGSYPLGSADPAPASPNAKDDEFDGTSSVSWTTFGSPASYNINSTRPGHLYLKASGTGSTLVGVVQAAPTSYPFTITACIADSTYRANFHRGGGLAFFPSGAITAATAPVYFGHEYNSGIFCSRITYSNLSTFASETNFGFFNPERIYLRAVVTSATAVSLDWSKDGWAWRNVQAYTLPFNLAQIGFGCSEDTGLGGVEMFADWFRIT